MNSINLPTRGVTLKIWELCDEAFTYQFQNQYSEFAATRLREWTTNGRMHKAFWADISTLVLMWAEQDLLNDSTAVTQFTKWKKAKMATADLIMAARDSGCGL